MPRSISVVINTWNSARTLPFALESVQGWCDDLVVVDMRSTDETRALAKAAGARVFDHEPIGYVEPARAFALEQATSAWVLLLDSDEMATPALRRALDCVIEADASDAVQIGRLNYFFGRPLLGGGWGVDQDRHVRFFRRGVLRPSERIHSPLEVRSGARVHALPCSDQQHLVHFNYETVSDFLVRLDRYTTIEAKQAITGTRAPGLLLPGLIEALVRWTRHGGWRDGWRGVYLAQAMMLYRASVGAKVRQHVEHPDVGSARGLEQQARRWSE